MGSSAVEEFSKQFSLLCTKFRWQIYNACDKHVTKVAVLFENRHTFTPKSHNQTRLRDLVLAVYSHCVPVKVLNLSREAQESLLQRDINFNLKIVDLSFKDWVRHLLYSHDYGARAHINVLIRRLLIRNLVAVGRSFLNEN